ncbi:hypothetical protein KC19_9G117700, partial [Ceratodon purpureus]
LPFRFFFSFFFFFKVLIHLDRFYGGPLGSTDEWDFLAPVIESNSKSLRVVQFSALDEGSTFSILQRERRAETRCLHRNHLMFQLRNITWCSFFAVVISLRLCVTP